MGKKIGIALTEEAWIAVEKLIHEVNGGFEGGRIGPSDAINEMILCAKVDVRALQVKHIDLRRSLRVLAAKKDLDVESVLRMLSDFKGKPTKKKNSSSQDEEV